MKAARWAAFHLAQTGFSCATKETAMATKLIRAGLKELDLVCSLFGAYREFYAQESAPVRERAYLEQRLEADQAVIFLAIDPDTQANAAGFVLLYPCFDSVMLISTWLLHDLYVARDYRRLGIGRMLMQTAHDFCRTSGAGRVDLATAMTNTVAQPLYESMGYQRDEKFYTYSLLL